MKQQNIFNIALKATTLVILLTAIIASVTVYNTPMKESVGRVLLFVSVISGVLLIMEAFLFGNRTRKAIAKMSTQLSKTERDSLLHFPAPVIIIDEDNTIVWYNKLFGIQVYSEDEAYGVDIADIVNIDMDKIFTPEGDLVCIDKKFYRAKAIHNNSVSPLTMVYFDDCTDFVELDYECRQSHKSVMIILIDNYEDVLSNLRESEKAHALVEIEKLIEDLIDGTNGVSKRMSNDRFWIVLEERDLSKIIESRFKILADARKISVGEKKNVTLSIGVGYNSSNLAESEAFAKQALEMCLGRGGDQAAVKTENGYQFFGGVSNGVEKHTKVKTRMIANALLELVNTHENVLIMGHRFGDLDSVGAATGLCCALKKLGKDASVVVNLENNLAKALIKYVSDHDISNYYIAPENAMNKLDDNTLVIVVDTHNPDLVESKEILERSKNTVVIDHHRLMVKSIEDSVLFYHEPIASSASEMVAEIIEYFGEKAKIPSPVAEALLAGIMLDTKNFVLRTGVRTFEAAAFLRKMGADTVAVKMMFSNSIETYQQRANLINSAKIYHKCAITCTNEHFSDLRIAASQAADELLGISGVNASFVLYENDGIVNISARSLGVYNVQVIMESLGGGGHLTMAATQLKTDLKTAQFRLKEAIDEYIINYVK